jgi:hypothetical protein
MTPAAVHHGHAQQLHANGAGVLARGVVTQPRTIGPPATPPVPPEPPELPTAALIRKPETRECAH